MAKKKTDGDWIIYTIRYQLPKFGSENEFLPDLHVFMVSTNKGADDARAAFEKFHHGSRLITVMDPLAASLDDKDLSITKTALAKLEKEGAHC